jgi:hypothetical protein
MLVFDQQYVLRVAQPLLVGPRIITCLPILFCNDFVWITIYFGFLQAIDTDISALVEIEKMCPHRFEFFIDLHGDQPVSARTALAYMKSGGHVSHAFYVYSCQLRQPNQVPSCCLLIYKSNSITKGIVLIQKIFR